MFVHETVTVHETVHQNVTLTSVPIRVSANVVLFVPDISLLQ